MSIQEMRRSYTLSGLHESDVDSDPMVQFQRWFHDANQPDNPDWLEINAMTLSTSDGAGRVTSRIVLLKGAEEGRFCFFTNYASVKGRQIESNPHIGLCFLWPHCERQVRVEGKAAKTPRDQSVAYSQSRPRNHQLSAHVSQQSAEIDNRELLQQQLDRLNEQYPDGHPIPCPDHWGGYEVTPTKIEFWQGRPNRLHDRICYEKLDGEWTIKRLSP